QIFEMANQGNEDVLRAIDLFTRDLAVQVYNLQSIFDPEKVAIGGGISAQPLLFEMLEKHLDGFVGRYGLPIPRPYVVPCHFRNDANLSKKTSLKSLSIFLLYRKRRKYLLNNY
ncbi:MAG: ROK family protein, partial [Coprobacillus sp.]